MSMEVERNHEYASKGVAGAGLGTGIAGLSLGVINTVGGLALAAMNNKKSSAASTVEAVVPAMAGAMALYEFLHKREVDKAEIITALQARYKK